MAHESIEIGNAGRTTLERRPFNQGRGCVICWCPSYISFAPVFHSRVLEQSQVAYLTTSNFWLGVKVGGPRHRPTNQLTDDMRALLPQPLVDTRLDIIYLEWLREMEAVIRAEHLHSGTCSHQKRKVFSHKFPLCLGWLAVSNLAQKHRICITYKKYMVSFYDAGQYLVRGGEGPQVHILSKFRLLRKQSFLHTANVSPLFYF